MSSLIVAALILAALGAPAVGADQPGFHLEPVASSFKRPLYVTASTNAKRLYVVEQRGVIKVLKRGAVDEPWQDGGIFLDLRDKVAGPLYSRGLLGMALHPRFAYNRYFYVFYARRHADPALNGDIAIVQYRARTGLRANPNSARAVLVIEHPSLYHLGGWMGFGPDSFLYVTTGDAAGDYGFAQDTESRLAKVLRFNPRKSEGAAGFVPADNPFVGVAGDDLVWAYGLRHPWRASFDRVTGDLWLSDPGDDHWEEINRFAPGATGTGANLGWPTCEGTHAYPPPDAGPEPCAAPDTAAPVIELQHADGRCSVIGGYVYRGISQPGLNGSYFFGDYCSGSIWSVPSDIAPGDGLGDPLDTDLLITSFGEDALGEIYLTALNGTLWRIEPD